MTKGCVSPYAQWSFSYLTPRQSDRSRGFGFIRMSTVEEATKCITDLNGMVRSLVTKLYYLS
jgi:RNA recognition motif-containing protein